MTSIDGVRPWVLPGTIARLISSLTTLIMIFFFQLAGCQGWHRRERGQQDQRQHRQDS